MERNLKIEKTFFRKRHGEVKPHRKVILEKVEEDAYLVKEYSWSNTESTWYPMFGTAYFNGEETVETGRVRIRKDKDIDRYFELCVKYEHFKYITE